VKSPDQENMMARASYIRFLAAAATLLLGSVSSSNVVAQPRDASEVKSLSLGLVSEINRKQIEDHFADFVRYVARRLNAGGAIDARVVTAPTPFELARLLDQRRVDFYMESAYATYIINFVHGAGKLLLRRWKSGLPDYHSVIFTRRSDGVKRVENLAGKTVVFEDAGSTSGYLLPKLYMLRRGLKLAERSRFTANTLSTDVSYFFAFSRDKLVDAVLSKQADAGAFSNDDLSTLDEKKKSAILVLAQTERLPRHLLSVRSDLDPAVVAKLEAILLSMHESDEGRRILQSADGTTKFDPLPGGESTMRRRLLDSFYAPEGR
jgi:phosphonate transport system substrate-binding protein